MKKLYFAVIFLSFFVPKVWGQTFLRSYTSASSFVKLDNTIFFAAGDEATGVELWKTDGTAEGTTLVKDIYPGRTGANVESLTVYKGKVYFSATDLLNGAELWVSDGTADGTKMLKDITASVSASPPRLLTVYEGYLFFVATDAYGFSALWRTDGTTDGTTMVKDGFYGIARLKVVGGKLYVHGGSYGGSLYESDGTATGTKKIDIDDYGSIDLLTEVNNELVLVTKYASGQKWRLYKLNPATGVITRIKSFDPVTYGSIEINNITPVGNQFFFALQRDNAANVYTDELWTSDGTEGGTVMVKSFSWTRHISNSKMQNFVAFKGKLCFAATNGYELWTSDGTAAGTLQASAVKLEPSKTPLLINDKIYFNTSTNQLWSYDGTVAKNELNSPNKPSQLFEFKDKVYFTAAKQSKIGLWHNGSGPVISLKADYYTLEHNSTYNMNAQPNGFAKAVVTIANTGKGDITLSDISVSGAPFYVAGSLKQVIKAGETGSFSLIYNPIKEEVIKGLLELRSNADYDIFRVELAGLSMAKTPAAVGYTGDVLAKKITFAEELPAFTLSQWTIAENSPIGSSVGSFDMNNTTSPVTYTIGAGSEGLFKIENGVLKTLVNFDYELKSVYEVVVNATSANGTVTKNFVVNIGDVQESVKANCMSTAEDIGYSLNDVAYAGSKLLAIGTGGKIIASDTDGETWRIIPSGVVGSLNSIRMFDQVGYVLGDQTLIKTENGGETWNPITLPDIAYPYVNKMYFYSASIGFLFGESKLYKTIDGGKSWKKQNAPNSGYIQQAMFMLNENEGFSCGPNRSLMSTKNGGDSWERVTWTDSVPPSTAFYTLNFTSSTVGYMSDQNGDIYKTTNAGLAWNKIGKTVVPRKITFVDANTAYAINDYGEYIYKTTDGGVNWVKENAAMIWNSALAFAAKADGSRFCAVGRGISYSTPLAGHSIWLKERNGAWERRSWIQSYYKFSSTIWTDDKTGYVFGEYSYKTIDGGITWKQMNIGNNSIYPLHSTAFFSNIGYCMNAGNFKKTVDGGETWTIVPIPIKSENVNVYYINSQKALLVGLQETYRTLDGGNTWEKAGNIASSFTPRIQFVNENLGFASQIGMNLKKTTDGGLTWKEIPIKDISVGFYTYFFDEQQGLYGGSDGQLFKTTDGGNTWQAIKTQFRMNVLNFSFFDRNHGYAMTSNYSYSEIFETFDGGETWQSVVAVQGDGRALVLQGVNGYGVGIEGPVLKVKSVAEPPVVYTITGEKIIGKGLSARYAVPTAAVSYQWTAEGATKISYNNNTIDVIWDTPGTYKLSVKAQNNCATGENFSMNVTVEDIQEPLVAGSATALNFSRGMEYTTPLHQNNTYTWNVTGGKIVNSNGNKVVVDWGTAGIGKVSVTEVYKNFNLVKTASLAVTIGDYPNTQFNIVANSITCKGSNNGKISITANTENNYLATITSPDNTVKVYPFTTNKEIEQLIPGTYGVCISLDGSAYQKCYTINITEPKDLSVFAVLKEDQQTLKLNLAGAKQYNIEVNGKLYQTTAANYEIKLNALSNLIKVSSDLSCQGVVEKTITITGISAYPNPVIDWLNINLSLFQSKIVTVRVSDLSGRVVLNQTQPNDAGYVKINFTDFNSGMYIIQVIAGTEEKVFKILKR